MQADPQRLLDLLNRWEAHWRAVDAPVVHLLQDGLSNEEIDALTAPLGLRLPIEARVLFGWHNGTRYVPGMPGNIGPAFAFRSLEKMVTRTQWLRDFATMVAETDPDRLEWDHSWFAIMDGIIDASDLALQTLVEEGQTAPVGLTTRDEAKVPDPARTFTDLVAMWVQCMDDGTYTWYPEDKKWDKPWPPPPQVPPLLHEYYT